MTKELNNINFNFNTDTLIKVKDLDLYYESFQALKKVNIDINKNTVTAFIGPSGCGKSTLLKTFNRMNDLVPNWPDVDGYIEGEYMDVQLSSGLEKSQTIADMHWSNEAQFFWGGEHKASDYVNLGFEVKKEGEYILDMNLTNEVGLPFKVVFDKNGYTFYENGKKVNYKRQLNIKNQGKERNYEPDSVSDNRQ